MQELAITPATIVILAVIALCVVLAVRRLRKRGMCDCNDHCEGGCAGCSKGSCGAAQMVANMEAETLK